MMQDVVLPAGVEMCGQGNWPGSLPQAGTACMGRASPHCLPATRSPLIEWLNREEITQTLPSWNQLAKNSLWRHWRAPFAFSFACCYGTTAPELGRILILWITDSVFCCLYLSLILSCTESFKTLFLYCITIIGSSVSTLYTRHIHLFQSVLVERSRRMTHSCTAPSAILRLARLKRPAPLWSGHLILSFIWWTQSFEL